MSRILSVNLSDPAEAEAYRAIEKSPGIPELKLAGILGIQRFDDLRKILSKMVEKNAIWVRRIPYQSGCVTTFQNTFYINKN